MSAVHCDHLLLRVMQNCKANKARLNLSSEACSVSSKCILVHWFSCFKKECSGTVKQDAHKATPCTRIDESTFTLGFRKQAFSVDTPVQ